MKAAPILGAGERRSPRWLRPPGVQKQRPGSRLEVWEPPRSLRSAPPLPLAALSGMSSQLSSRQPRAALCRACRRGCCARWPQRWSTTGAATALVPKTVDAAGQRAEASTDPSWPSSAGQGHGLRRAWADVCCVLRALVVESVGGRRRSWCSCVALAARRADPSCVDRPSSSCYIYTVSQ